MVGIIVLVACSIVIAAMCALCAVGRIPRNPFAGLRLPALFASEAAWKEGHRAAIAPTVAVAMVAAGLCIAVIALPDFAGIATIVTLVTFIIGLIAAGILANRAAHLIGPPESDATA